MQEEYYKKFYFEIIFIIIVNILKDVNFCLKTFII